MISQRSSLNSPHMMQARETSERFQGPKVPQKREGYILVEPVLDLMQGGHW